MRQTREVEFAEQCLQPWKEGLKRHRVNRQSGKDQSGRSQVMGQLHHLVLDKVNQSSVKSPVSHTYVWPLVDMESRLAIPGHLKLNLRNLITKVIPNFKSRNWT